MKASGLWSRVWRWLRWPVYVVAAGAILFFAWGVYLSIEKDKTDAAVAAIHAQKITLADVMGKNLPPVPNQIENDATVAGIDKNNNGIRDDVELAIFKKYPNSAKIRAAELQYAAAIQLMITRVFDTGTWIAAEEKVSLASGCVGETVPNKDLNIFLSRKKEAESLVVDIPKRQDAENAAYNFTTSSGIDSIETCDVDLNTLPN